VISNGKCWGQFLGPELIAITVAILEVHGNWKTHLCIAIVIKTALLLRFTTAAALINDHVPVPTLTAPSKVTSASCARYRMGYLGYSPDAMISLFQVVNQRYQKVDPSFYDNKSLRQWGRVLHDES